MADKDKKFIGEHGVDFREEIRIGLFWREMLGDELYLSFNADDMVRWYLALELAGQIDIRARLEERASNRPLKLFQGLSRAPHPPVCIGPGGSFLLSLVLASQSAASSYEVEVGHIEL